MKKIKSFTLAEVLITLVIIGIIAAVTVPVVMANHKKTETAAKLKKAYSMIVNAVRLSEIDHGVAAPEWKRDADISIEDFIEEYFSKYLSYTKIDKDCTYMGIDTENYLGPIDLPAGCIYLNDGTIMSFIGWDPHSGIYIDINGEKGPNEVGRDFFGFDFPDQDTIDLLGEVHGLKNIPSVAPLISGVNTIATKEEMIEDCAQPALSTDGPEWACTGVIASDGWEITSNYKKRL